MPPQKLTELCNAGEISDLREEHDNDAEASSAFVAIVLPCVVGHVHYRKRLCVKKIST